MLDIINASDLSFTELLTLCKGSSRDLVCGQIENRMNSKAVSFTTYVLFFDATDNHDRVVLRVKIPVTKTKQLKRTECAISWELNHYSVFDVKRYSYTLKTGYTYGDYFDLEDCKNVYSTIKSMVAKELPHKDDRLSSGLCEYLESNKLKEMQNNLK